MSSAVDVNILLYASDQASRFHDKATELLDRLARGPELLHVFWPVIIGYLRMATHHSIFPRPLSPEDALHNVEQLIGLPHARTAGESEGFWHAYLAATAGLVVRGNLVSDAHLVALLRQNGVATLWTHDRDFRKFEHVRVRDPFA